MSTSWRHGQSSRKLTHDFHRPRYENPLFSRKNNHGRHHNAWTIPHKGIFFGILAILFLSFLVWYGTSNAALHINDIQISGATPATEDAMRSALTRYTQTRFLFLFPHDHIFFFNTNDATKTIQNTVSLESLTIRKKIPRTLLITVQEKIPVAVFDIKNHLYAIDKSGFLIRELNEKEIASLHELPPGMDVLSTAGLGAETFEINKKPETNPSTNKNNQTPRKDVFPLILNAEATQKNDRVGSQLIGSQVVSSPVLEEILAANNDLPDRTQTSLRWFSIDPATETLDVTMEGDWHIFLSSTTPFHVQGDRLSIVLREKIGNKKPLLEYIDLRYNEKIFFRYKEKKEPESAKQPTP